MSRRRALSQSRLMTPTSGGIRANRDRSGRRPHASPTWLRRMPTSRAGRRRIPTTARLYVSLDVAAARIEADRRRTPYGHRSTLLNDVLSVEVWSALSALSQPVIPAVTDAA